MPPDARYSLPSYHRGGGGGGGTPHPALCPSPGTGVAHEEAEQRVEVVPDEIVRLEDPSQLEAVHDELLHGLRVLVPAVPVRGAEAEAEAGGGAGAGAAAATAAAAVAREAVPWRASCQGAGDAAVAAAVAAAAAGPAVPPRAGPSQYGASAGVGGGLSSQSPVPAPRARRLLPPLLAPVGPKGLLQDGLLQIEVCRVQVGKGVGPLLVH